MQGSRNLLDINLQFRVDPSDGAIEEIARSLALARAQRKKTFVGLDFSPSVAATAAIAAAIAADGDVTVEMGPLIPWRQLMICGRHRGGR